MAGSARAIVFDLDGTLVDSLDDITAALVAALGEVGLPAANRDQVRGWVGGGVRALIERAVEPAAVEAVLARFRVHYAAAPVAHTQLYPGISDALDALAPAHALAVLTNKPHDLATQITDRLLARWPFAAIVGHRDGVPLKPDPTAALAMAATLGIEVGHWMFVGDSPIDVATARAAGMHAIAVTWGYDGRAALVAAGPADVVDAPSQLVDVIGRI